MDEYAVSKQFAHFVQIWHVNADSEKDAWDRAETDGHLAYQSVYGAISPASNYVTNVTNNRKNNTISKEQYDIWLKEAIELGMKVDQYCGLPFNDVI